MLRRMVGVRLLGTLLVLLRPRLLLLLLLLRIMRLRLLGTLLVLLRPMLLLLRIMRLRLLGTMLVLRRPMLRLRLVSLSVLRTLVILLRPMLLRLLRLAGWSLWRLIRHCFTSVLRIAPNAAAQGVAFHPTPCELPCA